MFGCVYNNRTYHIYLPIVLRSETEERIVRNVHDLVWDKHWKKVRALEKNIDAAKKAGEDFGAYQAELDAVKAIVDKEIDERIVLEIMEYRADLRAMGGFGVLLARIEELESKVKEAQNTAEEALEAAEEAKEMVENNDDEDE